MKHFQTSAKHDILHLWLSTFLSLCLCFFLERYFTLATLGFDLLVTEKEKTHAAASGILSDIWMSFVLTLLIFFISLFLSLTFSKIFKTLFLKTFSIISLILAVVSFFLIALQIPYTDFYRALVSPSHALYIFDTDFVSASASSAFDTRVFVTTALPIFVTLVFQRLRPNRLISRIAYFFILLSPLCQVAKVQLNTQKFTWTPYVLRVNFLENLFIQTFKNFSFAPDFNENDRNLILSHYEKLNIKLTEDEKSNLNFLFDLKKTTHHHPWQTLLKNQISNHKKTHQPLYIFIIILESFRPEDGKFLYPKNPQTFQPFFDSIGTSSLSFTNGFSSGGVTRSGQESVLCGSWVGEYTSAMRNLPHLSPSCLFELTKKSIPNSHTGFWHGGNLAFDGQGLFWKKHGADIVIGRNDFPKTSPSTFWGVSDKTVFQKLSDHLKTNPSLFQMHAVMTMTNHADWGLPEDYMSLMKGKSTFDIQNPHPSWLTTAYTDKALELWFQNLKSLRANNTNTSIYENSLIILVNDHGTLLPSLKNPDGRVWGLSNTEDIKTAISQTHLNLLLTGGIVDRIRMQHTQLSIQFTHLVHQSDIFVTLCEILELEKCRSFSDSLFAETRRHPVFSDLGDKIFFPSDAIKETGLVLERSSIDKLEDNSYLYLSSFFKGYQKQLQ